MAAIDPSASPVFDVNNDKKPPRATLKMVRIPALDDEDSEEDSEDEDYLVNGETETSSDEDEDLNGGPSDPEKAKIAKAAAKSSDESDEDMEEDSEREEQEAKAALAKLKGKAKATGEGDDDDDEDDEDAIELDQEETVICTLDPEKVSHTNLTHGLSATSSSGHNSNNRRCSNTNSPLILSLARASACSSRSLVRTLCILPAIT